jgi:glutamate---cysteine ligase / carboxylate-amine ligase
VITRPGGLAHLVSQSFARERGQRDVASYFWWKLRPHPRLGTVEIRALDAQASLSDTAALVALVHCLAGDAAESGPGADPPPELIEEGMFRAARFGVHGQLPDAHGRRRAVSDILEDALVRCGWRP